MRKEEGMAEIGIYKAMCDAMADITSIAKDRSNVQQGFKFRGIDDVYNELHAILAKHQIFTMPEVLEDRTEERTTKNGGNLIYRVLKIKHHFIHSDGSEVCSTVIGEGMDSGDKAANKAMSIGHKYSLFQAFLIPTEDDKDPDGQSHDVVPKNAPQAQQKGKEPAKPVDDDKQKDMQKEIGGWLCQMYGGIVEAERQLELLTAWTTKDGKEIAGKKSVFDLNVKPNAKGQTQTSVIHNQVKKKYEEWKETEVPDAEVE
jgi:hypothetical protein